MRKCDSYQIPDWVLNQKIKAIKAIIETLLGEIRIWAVVDHLTANNFL